MIQSNSTEYNLYNNEDEDKNNENKEKRYKFYDGTCLKPYSGENREECNICLDNDSFTYKSWIKLGCYHYFHRHCIELWIEERFTCPICRENIYQE